MLKRNAFERAAKISHLVTSVTIGPNSSYSNKENSECPIASDIVPSLSSVVEPKMSHRVNKSSAITIGDLRALQQKYQQQIDDREIQEKVRKMLEARAQKDAENYRKIQDKLEKMKLDAEIKSKERKEALDRKIEASLKVLEQEEIAYQKQRADLMMNTRKILEQQENELKENLARLDDHFGKLENAFNKIVQTCNPGMSQIVEIYKRQLEEVKRQKSEVSSSLDGLKRSCINVEALCHALMAAINEYDSQLQARKAQKEDEDRQAQREAERIEAQAIAESIENTPPPAQPQQQPEPAEGRHLNQHQAQSANSAYYRQLIQFLNEKQEATRQLSEDVGLQNMRFALKMAVNSQINLLNETNPSSLIKGCHEFRKLLAGEKIETSQGIISINDYPQASDWTKLRLAEKLIVS